MIVDSYLEMYTTLYGWLWYNTIWDVLKDTGLLFLPFFGIILDHYVEYRKGFDDGDAEELTLRSLEVEIVLAIFVAVFAGSPFIDLKAEEVEYTPPAMYPGATGLDAYLTTETTRKPTDAIKDVTIGVDGFKSYPGQVQVPVWWTWVYSLSNGVSKAIMEDIPPTAGLRDYGMRLKSLVIKDPDLRKETEDFMRDCFEKAKAKYRREQPDKAPGALGAAVQTLLTNNGEDDPYWIGSHIYLSVSGYYNFFRSEKPHHDFAFDADRDTEWVTAPADGYGRPFCSEWWSTSTVGLKDRLIAQAGIVEKIQAYVESTFSTSLRHDALLKVLLQNSPITISPRGYDFLYGFNRAENDTITFSSSMDDLKQLFTSSVAGLESMKAEGGAMMAKAASYQIQALLLMLIVAFIPIVLFLSKFSLSAMFTIAWAIFTVKFFTVIWFFVWWVDDNLLAAMFTNNGGAAEMYSNMVLFWNNSEKILLLNTIINMLYWLGPTAFMVVSGWGGYHMVGQIGQIKHGISGQMVSAGKSGITVMAKLATKLLMKK